MSATSFSGQKQLAEELFTQGQVKQAISLLMTLNKSCPNNETEQRIIEMRHEGFFQLDYQNPLEHWPPYVEKQLCEIGKIPEIESEDLNADLIRDGIIGHGALILRNFCKQPFIEQMKHNIDNAIDAYDTEHAGKPLERLSPWYKPIKVSPKAADNKIARKWVRAASGIFGADSPRSMFDLLDQLENTKILTAIETYFGERPALSIKKTTLRRVPCDSKAGWHQDGAFLGENIRTVNLWIALTDCGTTAPSMDMVPIRLDKIVAIGTGKADFSWSIDNDMANQVAGDTPPQRLHFSAGDAILFDEMNLHRTGVSPGMTNERYAIEAWFFAPSCYPMAQLPILV